MAATKSSRRRPRDDAWLHDQQRARTSQTLAAGEYSDLQQLKLCVQNLQTGASIKQREIQADKSMSPSSDERIGPRSSLEC